MWTERSFSDLAELRPQRMDWPAISSILRENPRTVNLAGALTGAVASVADVVASSQRSGATPSAVMAYITNSPPSSKLLQRSIAIASASGKCCVSVRLSDLRSETATATLLMTATAAEELLQLYSNAATNASEVGGIDGWLLLLLHPLLERSTHDPANKSIHLSVHTRHQLVAVGRARHVARCGALRKNSNEACRMIVNRAFAEHCCFHSVPNTARSSNVDSAKEKVTHKRSNSAPQCDTTAKRSRIDTSFAVQQSTATATATATSISVNRAVEDDAMIDMHASHAEAEDARDISFSLRHCREGVLGLLGGVLGSNALHSADAFELQAARNVLQHSDNIAINSTNSGVSTNKCSASNTNISSSAAAKTIRTTATTSATAADATTAASSWRGQVPVRRESTISRVAVNKQIARSGNVSANLSQTLNLQQQQQQQQYSSGINYQTANSVASLGLDQNLRKVGASLINTQNLQRNARTAAPNAAVASTIARSTVQQQKPQQQQQSTCASNSSDNGNNRVLAILNAVEQQRLRKNSGNISKVSSINEQRIETASVSASCSSDSSTEKKLQEEIDQLLKKTSSHAAEAADEWFEGYEKRLTQLSKREYAQEMASKVQSIRVTAFQCLTCSNNNNNNNNSGGNISGCDSKRLLETFPTLCHQKLHSIRKLSDVLKRFFECGQCGRRDFSLTASADVNPRIPIPPANRCTQCGGYRWVPCGQNGSGPLSLTARDVRQLQSGPKSSQLLDGTGLVLSASEWTSRRDKMDMADRVSRL